MEKHVDHAYSVSYPVTILFHAKWKKTTGQFQYTQKWHVHNQYFPVLLLTKLVLFVVFIVH